MHALPIITRLNQRTKTGRLVRLITADRDLAVHTLAICAKPEFCWKNTGLKVYPRTGEIARQKTGGMIP